MKNFLSCYCSSTRRRVESPSLVNLTFPSHFLHTEIYNETSISLTKVWKRFIRFRGHRGGYMYKGGGNAIRVQATLTWTFFFFFFLKRVGHGNRTRIPLPLPPSFLPPISPPPPFRSFFSSTCLASTGHSTRFNYAPRPLPFVLALSRDTRTSGRDLLCASLFPFCSASSTDRPRPVPLFNAS